MDKTDNKTNEPEICNDPVMFKYKCSGCYYEALSKENIEIHIKETRNCSDAQVIVLDIKCKACNKFLHSELAKINHEKICKVKKLENQLEGLSHEKQNAILKEKIFEQNNHIETIEKQLRSLKYKYAREEEVNNNKLKNEYGLSTNDIHDYCIYTLRRLFEELAYPAIETNIELTKIKNHLRKQKKANAEKKTDTEKKVTKKNNHSESEPESEPE